MKKLFKTMTLLTMFAVFAQQSFAQESASKFSNKFSVNLSAGKVINFQNQQGEKGLNLSLGSLGLSYKLCPKFDIGVSVLGANDFEENDGDKEENDAEQVDKTDGSTVDMDNIEQEDGEDNDAADIVGGIMVHANYFPLNKRTLVIQPSAGFSLEANSPAYGLFVGYNLSIYKKLSVSGGFRYSGIISSSYQSAFKTELGLSWNF